ncbi:hypothetical protein FAES_2070 [Fibrella aestuarina BUZ 2]|uniref:Uncharacterized protein n=1 Tax=Fibrella aestuarina BUZ 2 TaxID=1166018 RepID=I0K7H6_9BACT|nr:hypothetical protein [Fibrella aestuarina]CCH00079.1 hypothetical protein FAES_2070 [Fibrella aestuarina BUZ 2]
MKAIPLLYLAIQLCTTCVAQTILPVDRVSFLLKNTLNYSRMFRAEGPGMAYGFTMGKHATTPCNWPVGSKLYFSEDGTVKGRLITTVTAADEGNTIPTDQSTPAQSATSLPSVTFRLASKSLLPRKFTLISYAPGEPGNSTTGFMLAPKGSRSFTFPVGTKLYLANSEQVDVVMSGKRIDDGKPFWIVKKDDQGKVIHCN